MGLTFLHLHSTYCLPLSGCLSSPLNKSRPSLLNSLRFTFDAIFTRRLHRYISAVALVKRSYLMSPIGIRIPRQRVTKQNVVPRLHRAVFITAMSYSVCITSAHCTRIFFLPYLYSTILPPSTIHVLRQSSFFSYE